MNAEIEITQEQKDQTAEMAANGMTVELIAQHIGISRATFYRKKELLKIFQKEYINSINRVAKTLINRALDGDTQLITFVMRMRGGWKEFSPVLSEEFPTKTHAEKQLELDGLLGTGQLTIDGYTKLSKSINEQYQVEEHESRLAEIERALKDRALPQKTLSEERNREVCPVIANAVAEKVN